MHEPFGGLARRVARRHAGEVVRPHGRPVGDLELRQPRHAIRAVDRGGHERHLRRERDSGGTRPRPVLELLDDAFRPPRPLGEHRDDLPLAAELDGCLHGLDVLLATSHGKRAAGAQGRPEDRVEELGLRHEVQLPPGPQRPAERPGVEVRRVVGGEHEAPFRQVLDAARLQSIEPVHERPAEDADEAVEGRWHHGPSIAVC